MSTFSRYILRVFFVQMALLLISFAALLQVFDLLSNSITVLSRSDGKLSGLSILFQVNNLSNEPYIAYAVTETRQQDFQEYGRQYLLGVNYRL